MIRCDMWVDVKLSSGSNSKGKDFGVHNLLKICLMAGGMGG